MVSSLRLYKDQNENNLRSYYNMIHKANNDAICKIASQIKETPLSGAALYAVFLSFPYLC